MHISKTLLSHILFRCLSSPLLQEAGVNDVAATDHYNDRGPLFHPLLLEHLAQEPGVHGGQHGATRDLHQHPVVISKPESVMRLSNMYHYYSIDMMMMALSDIY